jgi:ABC-type oligopeptide transport system ATPase subunit
MRLRLMPPVETGAAEELCAHPCEAYARQLIAATPEL